MVWKVCELNCLWCERFVNLTVYDVKGLGIELFMMGKVWKFNCLSCERFGNLTVYNVKSLGTELFMMWKVWEFNCLWSERFGNLTVYDMKGLGGNEVEWIGKAESRRAEVTLAGAARTVLLLPTPAVHIASNNRRLHTAEQYSPHALTEQKI